MDVCVFGGENGRKKKGEPIWKTSYEISSGSRVQSCELVVFRPKCDCRGINALCSSMCCVQGGGAL